LSGDFGSTNVFLYKNIIPTVTYSDPARRSITKDNMIRAASTVVACGLQKLGNPANRTVTQPSIYGQFSDLPAARYAYGALATIHSPFVSQWFSNGLTWTPVTPSRWYAQFSRDTASIAPGNIVSTTVGGNTFANNTKGNGAALLAVANYVVASNSNLQCTTAGELSFDTTEDPGTYAIMVNVRFNPTVTTAAAGTVFVNLLDTTASTVSELGRASCPGGVTQFVEVNVASQRILNLVAGTVYTLGFWVDGTLSLAISNIDWIVQRV
jgi:hypothetical protein